MPSSSASLKGIALRKSHLPWAVQKGRLRLDFKWARLNFERKEIGNALERDSTGFRKEVETWLQLIGAQCAKSSFRTAPAAAAAWFAAVSVVCAQEGPATSPGLSFEQVRDGLRSWMDGPAVVIFYAAVAWDYVVTNTSVAILVSAILAAVGAFLSIRSQRTVVRLRETFATINLDNIDKDVIDARTKFTELKSEIDAEKNLISKYADNTLRDKELERVLALRLVLNKYENLALGIRANIIDEAYLYRWWRGALLNDWSALTPLVTTYRHRNANPKIYIEFEGLATAWSQNRSYRTGGRMRSTNRRVRVW